MWVPFPFFLSCAFREQENDQAALPFPPSLPNVVR
jgi:hypothetical protein